ncbi:MAG: biotin-dependent carboxyltransferase family protein [Crocinitomicaceae bacterium]
MIEILESGLYSSIQDLGRIGYRKYGVPVSGAMDQYSAKLSNRILNNSENAPVLEITLIGPILKFNEACQIAISGAEFMPSVNNQIVENNTVLSILKGDVLKFGPVKKGMRTYLAILGGFESESLMGSASYYPNITKCRFLKKGGQLFFKTGIPKLSKVNNGSNWNHSIFNIKEIEVFKGPEFEHLSSEMKENILNQELKVSSQSNRMGYRLTHSMNLTAKEIITSPVMPGTVQLTPSGQLIILGRDAQTTGGYARVLQLTKVAQDHLSQIQFGKMIGFELSKGQ